MWFIKHNTTGKYFKDFQPRPNDDTPIWVDTTAEAKPFDELEQEEDFRGLYLSGQDAQPFEVP